LCYGKFHENIFSVQKILLNSYLRHCWVNRKLSFLYTSNYLSFSLVCFLSFIYNSCDFYFYSQIFILSELIFYHWVRINAFGFLNSLFPASALAFFIWQYLRFTVWKTGFSLPFKLIFARCCSFTYLNFNTNCTNIFCLSIWIYLLIIDSFGVVSFQNQPMTLHPLLFSTQVHLLPFARQA